eukprot:6482063-Amphidinium_carterae.4
MATLSAKHHEDCMLRGAADGEPTVKKRIKSMNSAYLRSAQITSDSKLSSPHSAASCCSPIPIFFASTSAPERLCELTLTRCMRLHRCWGKPTMTRPKHINKYQHKFNEKTVARNTSPKLWETLLQSILNKSTFFVFWQRFV